MFLNYNSMPGKRASPTASINKKKTQKKRLLQFASICIKVNSEVLRLLEGMARYTGQLLAPAKGFSGGFPEHDTAV